jgi:hypothetical protein
MHASRRLAPSSKLFFFSTVVGPDEDRTDVPLDDRRGSWRCPAALQLHASRVCPCQECGAALNDQWSVRAGRVGAVLLGAVRKVDASGLGHWELCRKRQTPSDEIVQAWMSIMKILMRIPAVGWVLAGGRFAGAGGQPGISHVAAHLLSCSCALRISVRVHCPAVPCSPAAARARGADTSLRALAAPWHAALRTRQRNGNVAT